MTKQESKKFINWLKFAEEDLKASEELLASNSYFPHIAAYHCQQTAEKCLKAFIISNNKVYPKTHDLIVLLNACKKINSDFEDITKQISLLTPLYIEEKYPFEPIDDYEDKELRSFVKSAEEVFNFVKNIVK